MAEGEMDLFKAEFKFYKKISADHSHVLDFRCSDSVKRSKVGMETCKSDQPKTEAFGLKPLSEWKIYTVPSISGLLILPDLFQSGGQHYWVKRCLKDYPCKPNICNLDAHMQRDGDGSLWPHNRSDQVYKSDICSVESCRGGIPSVPERKRMKISQGNAEKEEALPIPKESPLYRLRWVTLGYHYNWTTKEYKSDMRSPFPSDLAQLSSLILHHAGFPRFKAEAAIVNYYHLDSSLSGHTDHSEKDLTQPLLSISFGQSAIFLIGGKTKQVRPIPILLKSGDVMIMSGDARLAYHGVPKILSPSTSDKEQVPTSLSAATITHGLCHYSEGTNPTCAAGTTSNDCLYCCELVSLWHNVTSYLSMSRININVRQVISDQYKF